MITLERTHTTRALVKLGAVFAFVGTLIGVGDVAWAADAAEAAAGAAAYKGALGNSRIAALMFWLLAGSTCGGALFVITRKNLVVAVMGMVGTFFAIAALYAMLYAHFLAVIQILVYAGAIMVLFVFVVMVINRAEEQPWAVHGLLGKAVAGGALLYLLVRLAGVLWSVKDHAVAVEAAPTAGVGASEFGTVARIGEVLFTDYLFPFEAVSVVLLVAVVGAVAVARPHTSRSADAQESASAPEQEGAQ